MQEPMVNNPQQPQGAMAPQQPQEPPFTFGTAIQTNQQLVDRQTAQNIPSMPSQQGLGGNAQAQPTGPQLTPIDEQALTAVKEGRVAPEVVLQDNRVSDLAKNMLQSTLQAPQQAQPQMPQGLV